MKKLILTFAGACLLLAPVGCVDQVNLSNLGEAAVNLHAAASVNDEELKEMCVQMRELCIRYRPDYVRFETNWHAPKA